MKLHLQPRSGLHLISRYATGSVSVNEVVYTQSLILLPDTVVTDWGASGFAGLNAAHFERLAGFRPEVALLGTGVRQRFPAPVLTAALAHAGIGLEVMDTGAACRTYNILAGEGRRVAAALILE